MNDTDAFDASVQAVRAGADPHDHAKALYDRLTEVERLGLLDGDEAVWPGLKAMMTEGYNVRPSRTWTGRAGR